MATAKQISARKHFKTKIEKAKQIHEKNPKKSWKTCVKEAFKK